MEIETNQERQNNEHTALKSIYGDTVVNDKKKVAWNGWSPNNILLSLQPIGNSQGVHCSADLQFQCCINYPDLPPKITITKTNGLSDENVKKLLQELNEKAEQLRGEVMIYELAQHTRQFLDDHNKPTFSCYEEMVREKNKMEKLKEHDKLVKETEELKRMKEEIHRRQEELCEVSRSRASSLTHPEDNNGHGDAPKLIYYADSKQSPVRVVPRQRSVSVPCTCKSRGAQVLKRSQRSNKKVYMGNCIGHSSAGSTTYLGIDDDGERIIAKKWCLKPASDFQIRKRQLTTVETELKAMCRIKHQSLIPYTAMETTVDTKHTRQYIYIFRNFIMGSSLKFLQNRSSSFGDKFEALKLVRHVGMGVLCALKELHHLNILHRDIKYENVYLENSGTVKLVGASLDARLNDMVYEENDCDGHTKSQDIFATGQMLLSIISQEDDFEIPADLPASAKDFFSRCFTEDEHTQWTAEQLMTHSFLTDAPEHLPVDKENNMNSSESEDEDVTHRIQGISSVVNGHSRLNVEFDILAWLGKGAYGNVFKVKNKLDGGLYAIKHIKLNPKDKESKTIIREVKHLSRLNHENVVRYYNAWIETISDTGTVEVDERSVVQSPGRNENSLLAAVTKLEQDVKMHWSMTDSPVRSPDESSDTDSSSDDDDDYDDDMNGLCYKLRSNKESSFTIEFEDDSAVTRAEKTDITVDDRNPAPTMRQALYIQMEFCEKNTLRQAIDNGLYQENFRAWRLFREILEGLSHVHQKGMIHRDLKPVNIFLDSNDHVKIGDFGLATKVLTDYTGTVNSSQDYAEGPLTGKVGTALYVAPELQDSAAKVFLYNQKVDIYSLGIILFEMFHQPFETGSERCNVLVNLRSKEIIMPQDFVKNENSKQIHVIRWLLNHNPSLRPTTAELLASEHVPRTVPEGALSGLLSHTLSNRGSRGYQRMIAACLDQKPSTAEDFLFHSTMKSKPLDVIAAIKEVVTEVFKSHGAAEFSPPLLMPRASKWDEHPSAVKLMTISGAVCHLPHDLRLPFARYTAYTGTKYLRRYVCDRVYRETERTAKGFHPREIIECAFDIVTPRTESLWPDAELLVVASRAAMATSLKVTIQLNHTDLLETLLIACGLPQDKHPGLYPVLVDVSLGRITQLQLHTHLATLCLSDYNAKTLLRLMEADLAPAAVRQLLQQLRTHRDPAQERALRQLETVTFIAQALGCHCPLTVAPLLAYNATQHSGVFWQMLVFKADQKTSTKHRSKNLIAAGGRYDDLVKDFWKVARAQNDGNSDIKCSSVGFSLSLERIAAIVNNMEIRVPIVNKEGLIGVACVCVGVANTSVGSQESARLLRLLWKEGLAAFSWEGLGQDARDVTHAPLILIQDGAFVHVSCWEANRVRDYKVLFTEIVDFIKQKLSPENVRSPDYNYNRSLSWSESEKSNSLSLSVTFITASDRVTKSIKRHHEVQINNQMTATLAQLGMTPMLGRVRASVLALACEGACVRLLASHLTVPLVVDQLAAAFRPARQTFPKLNNLLEEALQELRAVVKQSNQSRSPEDVQVFALYAIPESVCRIIT